MNNGKMNEMRAQLLNVKKFCLPEISFAAPAIAMRVSQANSFEFK